MRRTIDSPLPTPLNESLPSQGTSTIRRALGSLLLLLGAWMMLSPQAVMGLEQLRWMADYAFPGEVLLGAAVIAAAYYLIAFRVDPDRLAHED